MRSDKPRTKHFADLGSLAALILMLLWFGHEMVTQAKVPFFRDLGPYFYPIRLSLTQSLNAGELPLWDRHVAAGFPLLADFQSGTFYPPHLAFLLFAFFSAISVLFLFHYLVAATGSYFLCRHWGYPPYLSIIGAILFAFGGVVVSLTNLLNHFQSAVWLPWVILFAGRCLRSYCWRNFLLFTAALLLQFLAGSPEFYAMSMVLVVLASIRLKPNSAKIWPYSRLAMVLLGANALVIALAMVQIAPTVELLLHSRRSHPLPLVEATNWSLNPLNLFNLFFLDKEVDTTIFPGMHFFFLNRASFFISHYLGAISLFGLSFWILYSSSKERIVTIAVLLLTLVLAVGSYTPVYPFMLRSFPVMGLLRFPEKYFFLTYSLLWFAALKGLFVLFETGIPKPGRAVAVMFGIPLVLLLFYLFLRLNTGLLSQFIAFRARTFADRDPTYTVAAFVLVSVERQFFLSLGLSILFFAMKTRIIRAALLQCLLVIVVFVDLDVAHRGYQYFLDPSFIYKNSTVISVPERNPTRVFYYPAGSTLHPAQLSILTRPSYVRSIALVYSNLLPNSGVFYGFDYFQEIDAISRRPYLDFLEFADRADPETRFRLLGALNVKYLISFKPLAGEGVTLIRRFPEYPSWLYKIDKPVPRVYVVNKSTVQKNSGKVLQQLGSSEFDPLREVILDRDAAFTPRHALTATARITRYQNQSVTIHASLNDVGILILADSYYPGWQAYVDGNEVPILKANHFFRAVVLPEGEHVVDFKYAPLSIRIGVFVSFLTIVLITAISIFLFVRRNGTGRLSAISKPDDFKPPRLAKNKS
ncbi:MAG: YfhO family protein [Alphaproteobacteria bacterium]